jgi:hypothetical protein
MNPELRLSAAFSALFGTALLLEGAWIEVGRSGLGAATDWAGLHAKAGIPSPMLGGVAFFGLAWALLRRYRWAWLVAFTWATIWVLPGLALMALLFLPRGAAWARQHRVETLVGALSVASLVGSLITLSRPAVRGLFRRQHGRLGNEDSERVA